MTGVHNSVIANEDIQDKPDQISIMSNSKSPGDSFLYDMIFQSFKHPETIEITLCLGFEDANSFVNKSLLASRV